MHRNTSKFPRASSWNKVSADSGPVTSRVSARSRATAGAMTSRSSVPMAPFSPAWGLSPATASRGARPRSPERSRATTRAWRRIRSSLMAPATSLSGIWTVSGTVRKDPADSIITGSAAWPASRAIWARKSVWPWWAKPVRYSASLWIGLVTIPATRPSSASAAAASMAPTTAGAAAGSSLPGKPCPSNGASSTGSAVPKAATASSVAAMTARGTSIPNRLARRARQSALPTTTKASPPGARRCQAINAISGPMPAGSPRVSASGRGETMTSRAPAGLADGPGPIG
jgi:hypothetical protein